MASISRMCNLGHRLKIECVKWPLNLKVYDQIHRSNDGDEYTVSKYIVPIFVCKHAVS